MNWEYEQYTVVLDDNDMPWVIADYYVSIVNEADVIWCDLMIPFGLTNIHRQVRYDNLCKEEFWSRIDEKTELPYVIDELDPEMLMESDGVNENYTPQSEYYKRDIYF